MAYWLDHVYEYVELLFESSLWSFCCLFHFPDPLSPSSVCQKPKKYKWVPRVFWRQMWVLSDVSADSPQHLKFEVLSTDVMSNNITAWAQRLSVSEHVTSMLLDFCVRRDCGVCVLTARWMCDARSPLLGRIQMGFCSVRERRPRQIERGSACPSANSWCVPREPALFFGSCRLIGKLFY